jgi:hypothetical protein
VRARADELGDSGIGAVGQPPVQRLLATRSVRTREAQPEMTSSSTTMTSWSGKRTPTRPGQATTEGSCAAVGLSAIGLKDDQLIGGVGAGGMSPL